MKKFICIDSNIFIWGLKGVASPGQEDSIQKAKNFISWLDSKEYGILLPTPMMAEILSPVPFEERGKILSLIDKRFIVAPFDVPASTKCAELLHNTYTNDELIQYRINNAIPKQKMKYDCMITAICIVRKVACIYTTDPDITKFANGQILVKDLPNLSIPGIQTEMFPII